MKRLLLLFISLLLVVPFSNVEAKDKINMYVFYGDGCGYCASLHSYLDELMENSDYNYMFQVANFEVWGSYPNSALMYEVGDYFEIGATGVPFYVIGDEYFVGFDTETSPAQIEVAIKEAYNDEDYEDVVASIINSDRKYRDVEMDEEVELPDTNSNTFGTDEENSDEEVDYQVYIKYGIGVLIIIICAYYGFKRFIKNKDHSTFDPNQM